MAAILAAAVGPAALANEEAQREAMARVLEYAEESHYSSILVDDRISRSTLENYLAALDELRLLFTQEDEALLGERYGDRLDDAMRQGQVEPVFEIHRLYLQRQAQYRDFAKNYLATRPSLNTSRKWLRNRWAAPRPRNRAEQEQVWQDWVRHEWINLVLEGWTYESARARLRHRYLFGDPLGVDSEGFSFSIGELPGGRQPGADPYDARSAYAMFLNAFARALDSNSNFQSPESVWELAERMEDVGLVRLSLDAEGEYVVVREQPAEIAADTAVGLQVGDRIIEVDPFGAGEFIGVVGWQPFEIHNLVFGPTDTMVVFRVLPAGVQTGAVERTAKRISVVTKEMKRALRWTPKWLMDRSMNKMLQSERNASRSVLEVEHGGRTLRVDVVRIPEFYENCARDVRRLVRELKDEGMRALVVDVRNNIFGESDEVISLIGLFVGKGPVSQERDRGGRVQILRNTRQEAIWDGPMAVLVNQGSSSAAEIFAAAIQDYGRAVVVGERTFARGTSQVEFKVKALRRGKSDDPVLRITNREFFRVTGKSIDQTGVQPDILLTMADEYSLATRAWASGIDRSGHANASNGSLRPIEIHSANFRRQESAPELLDSLAARHQQRASQDIDWSLIAGYLKLSQERMQRRSEPIHLDARRQNQATQWAEELTLAKDWIEARGPQSVVTEPALAEFFLEARGVHVPENEIPNVEEPELVRAIMLAKGLVAVEGENGYQQSSYDLPLQQAASIAADWVRLQDGAASAASASGGYP
ncbi:MAG: carboxy terminal-processing peptidase [Gammaproteobacteria bacterium]|nr:carboxy terminal-processing peptidase [Gammaproteobacteria bacterium]